MSIQKKESFTPEHLQNIEEHYRELDKLYEEKDAELHKTLTVILDLEELIQLFEDLTKQREESKADRQKLKCVAKIAAVLFGVVGFIVSGFSLITMLLAFSMVLESTHFLINVVTRDQEYTNYTIKDIAELENKLGLSSSLNYEMAKELLRQKEVTRDTLRIEVNALKQKVDYFKNLIDMIDFYLDFPSYKEKYNKAVSFIKGSPYLYHILQEAEEMEEKENASFIENAWQEFVKVVGSYKTYSLNASLIEKEWQEFVKDAGSYKNYNQESFVDNIIKLKYTKD